MKAKKKRIHHRTCRTGRLQSTRGGRHSDKDQ